MFLHHIHSPGDSSRKSWCRLRILPTSSTLPWILECSNFTFPWGTGKVIAWCWIWGRPSLGQSIQRCLKGVGLRVEGWLILDKDRHFICLSSHVYWESLGAQDLAVGRIDTVHALMELMVWWVMRAPQREVWGSVGGRKRRLACHLRAKRAGVQVNFCSLCEEWEGHHLLGEVELKQL